MTRTVPMNEGFFAFYVGRDKKWRLVRDASGEPITCATEAIALSVARYRRRRLKIWR